MSGTVSPRAAGPWAGRTLIVINPAAGQSAVQRLRRRLGAAFAERGASFDIAETEYAGHATELAREAASLGYRTCCVAGGDGTIAEVATGLAGTDVPLAVIPRGTANQVAQNLGIPLKLEAAVDVAVRGRALPLDLGEVGGRSFALAAGAGYDAAVMAAATREMKERFGFAAYLLASLREAVSVSSTEFHIVADGRELTVRAMSVMLANVGELFTPYLGVRFPLGPSRQPTWQDGLLDVIVIAPDSMAGLAAVLWRAARRQFGGDGRLIHFQAERITVRAEPDVGVQLDGDPAGSTPIVARAVRHGLRVLLP